MWASAAVEATIVPGATVEHTLTFRVNHLMEDVTANASAAGGTVWLGELPKTLEPDHDYQLTVTMSLAEDRKQWPLRGTIMVRSGRRSIGPVMTLRGVAAAEPTAAPGTRTATPTKQATPKPGVTVTPQPAKVGWEPTMLRRSMLPGEVGTATVSFTVTQPVAAPQFRMFARDGAVSIDPSSLPASLEPGQTYTITLSLRMPAKRATVATGTILIRDGNRSLGRPLAIRLTALKPTPTPAVGI